jgi:microcystin-dependent protein
MTWNAATPAGTDSIRDGDDAIRELKVDLAAALATEGVFPGADTANPVFRWKPRYGAQSARPAVDAVNPGTTYYNTDRKILQRDSGTAWLDLTHMLPSGVVLDFPGTVLPDGYLWCDGASYLRADYPALFAALGTAAGAADGTHFNVPDRRGRFVRGQDEGTGRDPDAATRTAQDTGGNTGDNPCSIQADEYKAHVHTYVRRDQNIAYAGGTTAALAESTNNSGSSGGNETRPINAYTRYIIKT